LTKYLLILDDYAKQMEEIKCKFVAIDAETAPSVKKALERLTFKCAAINMEDTPVENAINFSDLLKIEGILNFFSYHPEMMLNYFYSYSNRYKNKAKRGHTSGLQHKWKHWRT
jgi:hypothetical protein